MKKKIFFTVVLIGMFLAASFLFASGTKKTGTKAAEKKGPITVRIAHLFPANTSMGEKMQWVADQLEKRSNGRFQCKVFAGGVAGGEKENLEDLLAGNIELMCGAGSYFYKYVPELNVEELPLYFWKSQEEANRVLRGYWPKFVKLCEAKGFYPIGLDVREFMGIWVRHPIKSLHDLRGMKFRSINSDYYIAITKMYGAIPIPMPFGDAYMAFKEGVADGAVDPIGPCVGANWQEVLKCYVDTRLILSRSLMLTSKKFIDSLPPDLRKIMLQVGKDAETEGIKILKKYDAINRKKMLDAGMTIIGYNQIDPKELEELKIKGLKFRDEYMKSKGPKVYKFYKDWIKYVEKATGRPQGLPK